MNGNKSRVHGITWGYALIWYGQFLGLHTDPLYARLEFLKQYGFKSTGIHLDEIVNMTDAQRDRLGQFLTDHDLQLTPRVGYAYLEKNEDVRKRHTERIAEQLDAYLPLTRGRIVTTAMHAGHRFDRQLPLDDKMELVAGALQPLAAVCEDLGAPLSVENHGDYYVSDIVDLCKAVPHLYIYLDTGNTYLIGEKPIDAFKLAAPYTVGSHFKDHRVQPRPEARPLHFEVDGSAIGEGDVPLRECFDLLMEHAPRPDVLVMELEMISPTGMDPIDCLNRSIQFVKSLGGELK